MTYRQARWDEPSVWDLSAIPGPEPAPAVPGLPERMRRKERVLWPELSELQVLRHYTRLSQMNFGIESGPYALGSCTMKYNPRVSEVLARRKGAAELHPNQPESTVQGALEILWRLERILAKVTGLPEISLQPGAGAHGEYAALLMVRAYFLEHGELERRTEVLLPDTAHGTNPASASMAGFTTREIASKDGCVDLDALKAAVSDRTACFMLTNPNTAGLFESQILEIAETVHGAGGMLYYDGANLNAILGITHPGRMGFDVAHLNLHKTFATPHGGGGPGPESWPPARGWGPICPSRGSSRMDASSGSTTTARNRSARSSRPMGTLASTSEPTPSRSPTGKLASSTSPGGRCSIPTTWASGSANPSLGPSARWSSTSSFSREPR